jgi:PAS domain S-box-containing protein
MVDDADGQPGPAVFAISAEQADRILLQTLTREFPDALVQPVTQPHAGFAASGRYAIHRYTVSALRVPAIGRLPDGSLVEGFRFEVRASGTMPRSVRTAVGRLAHDLERRAGLITDAEPLASASAAESTRAALDGRTVPDWLVLSALALGLVVGLAAGSRLSLLAPPARAHAPVLPHASAPGGRPRHADRSWWNSELLDMTHDAVIVWEMDGGGILYWNYAAERLYGFDCDEAHGKITHELLQTQLAGSVNDLERKLARYGVWVGELIHRTRDGRRISVEGRLALLSQRDGRWLVLEVNRDVTDSSRAAAARSEMEDRMIRLRGPDLHSSG